MSKYAYTHTHAHTAAVLFSSWHFLNTFQAVFVNMVSHLVCLGCVIILLLFDPCAVLLKASLGVLVLILVLLGHC